MGQKVEEGSQDRGQCCSHSGLWLFPFLKCQRANGHHMMLMMLWDGQAARNNCDHLAADWIYAQVLIVSNWKGRRPQRTQARGNQRIQFHKH